ncbi:UDP-glucuronosyltransferase 1A9-like isoform X2 [Lineus longissimus]
MEFPHSRRKLAFMYLFLALVIGLEATASKKILILPSPFVSHLMQMDSLADGLIARGYDVYTILHSSVKVSKAVVKSNVKVIDIDPGIKPLFQTREFEEVLVGPELLDLGFLETFRVLRRGFDIIKMECRNTLLDTNLFKKIEAERFDFVIVDGMVKCLTIFPHKLGLPFAIFMSHLPPDIPHATLQAQFILPGVIDDILSLRKLPRVLATIGRAVFVTALFNAADQYFMDFHNTPIFEIQKESKLWLCDIGMVLDTPKPVSPNAIHVGGLNIRKAKSLPEGALKQFVDSASDGFVLVSFGSFVKYFPDKIVNILLDTFRDVPYKIVWKWDKHMLKADQVLPRNVLAVNWVPQNDVLGHRNIKLFLTHCGNGGQHEALYNGVPMVGLPLFADQMFNCKRVEGRFGRHIRGRNLSKDKLLNMIMDVIRDQKYFENVKKASAIFRDQPMEPREIAAYWVDHVIKYGASHLQSKTNEMSWIQILMWDVLFVVCAVIFIALIMVFLTCRCVYRRCCRRDFSKEKAKQS